MKPFRLGSNPFPLGISVKLRIQTGNLNSERNAWMCYLFVCSQKEQILTKRCKYYGDQQ